MLFHRTVVAYIDELQAPKKVKNGTKDLFKLVVNNNEGSRIEITIWNNVIPKYANFFKINGVSILFILLFN